MLNLDTIIKHGKNFAIVGGLLWAIYTEWGRYQQTSTIAREVEKDYQVFKNIMVKDTLIYNNEFKEFDDLTDSIKMLKKELIVYKAKFDYLQNRTKFDSIDLNLVYSAVKHSLEDCYINNIRFKKAKDGTLYYVRGSLLYPTTYETQTHKYCYIGDDGKTYYCE